MAKKQYQFFRHQLAAMQDDKITDLLANEGMEGYGIYWALLELLGQATDYRYHAKYKSISYKLHVTDEAKVQRVVEDYGLFVVEDGFFFSRKFTEQMHELTEKYLKRAAAGAAGAAVTNSRNKVGNADNNNRQSSGNADEKSGNAEKVPQKKKNQKEKEEGEEKENKNNDELFPKPNGSANNCRCVGDNDAAPEEFNFSEDVNDREYLEITKQYMYKYASSPSSYTDRLIALLSPDQWKGSRGTDFSQQKHKAADLFVKVELPDKYRSGRGGQCTKSERGMVDTWLRWIAEAHIHDTELLDCYRGLEIEDEAGHKRVRLFVREIADANYIENNYMMPLSRAIYASLGSGTQLEYRVK